MEISSTVRATRETPEARRLRLRAQARTNPKNPQKQRSAVSNGKRLHVAEPGNTAFARRYRDILAQIIADISGPDGLSEGQRQLARRAATIAIACEKMEGEAAAGRDIDLETFGQLTDRLGRTFNRLGLKRQQRDVTPSFADAFRADAINQQRQQVARREQQQREFDQRQASNKP
jgi:hypothetical protein